MNISPAALAAVTTPSVGGNYVIEGVDDLDEVSLRHMEAFYTALLPIMIKKAKNCSLFFKEKYDKIIECLQMLDVPGTTESSLRSQGFTQVTQWKKKYALVNDVLVHLPKGGNTNATNADDNADNNADDNNDDNESDNTNNNNTDASGLTRPSYYERVFADLNAAHGDDHKKCRALFNQVNMLNCNIPRTVQLLFTNTCPVCITKNTTLKKPVAGLKSIIAYEFGQRGQMDLIDLQSIADGEFKYLLNYIDHCTKYLFCIPLTSKRADAVAQALVSIFTIIGPPLILQTDNGGEFVGVAYTDKEIKCMELDDAVRLPYFLLFRILRLCQKSKRCFYIFISPFQFMDSVIRELKALWPNAKVVRGSPRHCQSQGGVERVNQTVEKKLGYWMITNKSTRWSIGCKFVAWLYNTSYHNAVKNLPFVLLFGHQPKVGISNLPIDHKLLNTLATEADLNKIIQVQDTPDDVASDDKQSAKEVC